MHAESTLVFDRTGHGGHGGHGHGRGHGGHGGLDMVSD